MASSSGRFESKNALVIGGSSGIGRAVVMGLAREGARVTACARSADKLAGVSRECAPGMVETAVLDVRDIEQVQEVVERTAERLGSVDVLVNSAGIAYMEPVLEISPKSWQDTIDTNLTGAFFAAQSAARHMIAAGGGSIVNIASIDAFIAESPFAHYNASKAALTGTRNSSSPTSGAFRPAVLPSRRSRRRSCCSSRPTTRRTSTARLWSWMEDS
jgi:NAD(P)-dependent dehydrogenase (short-subunit alcohol dehydrogenase family)